MEAKENVKPSKTAIVIGSGIAGIAIAIRLVKKGYRVKILEQFGSPGGKLSEYRWEGFRFDCGPSLFTLPELVDDLFILCGEKPEEHFKYSPIQKSCRYFWPDGLVLDAWQNTNDFGREVEQKTGVRASTVISYLNTCKNLYELTADIFLFESFHKLSNFTKKSYKKVLFRIYQLDAFFTMHKRNRITFKNNYITQLFDRYATYNGSNPYKTPATLKMIAHLEHSKGAFFPDKGMYHIVEALVDLAKRNGVEFCLNTRAEEIVMENKLVKAVRANNQLFEADLVVSDIDVVNLFRKLLPGQTFPSQQIKKDRSSSALIFYWSMNQRFEKLDLHNILFSANYKDEFEHLFSHKDISSDPTVYIFISSKHVNGDAPDDCENWFVMVNAPSDTGQDWGNITARLRKAILHKIKTVLNIDVEPHIINEQIATPQTIEKQTGSFQGSLYGLSSNGMLAAFYRHPNFKKSFPNLFFVGGSVHPGGGIPLCLASAMIVDKEIPSAHIKQ